MPSQALFGISVALSLIAWGIVATRYIWPALRNQARADALRPLLLLHSFRFVGLALLYAFYEGNHSGLEAGQLGAAYFIPTVLVPLLLNTHGLVFRILLRHDREEESLTQAT